MVFDLFVPSLLLNMAGSKEIGIYIYIYICTQILMKNILTRKHLLYIYIITVKKMVLISCWLSLAMHYAGLHGQSCGQPRGAFSGLASLEGIQT